VTRERPRDHVPELEPAAIRAARDRIDPAFLGSPQYVHEGLTGRLGVPVIVKVETVNPIRSFKGRGTWLAVSGLAAEGGSAPIGRSLRLRRQLRPGRRVRGAALGIPPIVFDSRRANRGKVERMRALGAEVIEAARTSTRPVRSRGLPAEHEVELLVDGDDSGSRRGPGRWPSRSPMRVAAGDLPAPVVASIPVGNGALINGVGCVAAARAAGVPRRRDPGRGGRRDGASFAAGRPIDTDPPTRTPTASRAGSRSRPPSSGWPGASTRCARSRGELHDGAGDPDRGARDHRRGRRGRRVGRARGRLRADGPALMIVTGSNV
jgi:threonine dehydratase